MTEAVGHMQFICHFTILMEWMLHYGAQPVIYIQSDALDKKTDTIYDCYPERMGGTLRRKRVEDLFACRHPD